MQYKHIRVRNRFKCKLHAFACNSCYKSGLFSFHVTFVEHAHYYCRYSVIKEETQIIKVAFFLFSPTFYCHLLKSKPNTILNPKRNDTK